MEKCPVMKDKNSVSYKRSLLIGMLLGDASSRKFVKAGGALRAEYSFRHCKKQCDFIEWKSKEINRLFNAETKVHEGSFDGYSYSRFSITKKGRMRVIHDWFHREGIKVITDKIKFMDHPIGLAVLLCDDGSIRKRKKKHRDGTIYYLSPSVTIATHNFDVSSFERLMLHIQEFCGAKGYNNHERRWRKGHQITYNRANFNVENSRILWNYVREWIPMVHSMKEKFAFAIDRFDS